MSEPLLEVAPKHKFSCRIGWHKWSSWSNPKQMEMNGLLHKQERTVVGQTRQCRDCGKMEYRLL